MLRIRRTTSLSIATPKARAICWAMWGKPQLGFRRFISTTAPMSSFSGPFGPGRRPRLGENNMRYLRFLSRLWKYSRVEGLQHNRRTDKTCRANEQGTQTGDDPIRSAQLGRMFATAILRSAADGGPARIRQPMRKPRILAMVSRHQS